MQKGFGRNWVGRRGVETTRNRSDKGLKQGAG